MRKVARRSITQEILFEAEDGKQFSYEGQAIEHDLKLLEKDMNDLKKGDLNIPDLNLIGGIYKIQNEENLKLIHRYCELKNFSFEDPDIPANIVITNDFVLSVHDLKNLVEDIANL